MQGRLLSRLLRFPRSSGSRSLKYSKRAPRRPGFDRQQEAHLLNSRSPANEKLGNWTPCAMLTVLGQVFQGSHRRATYRKKLVIPVATWESLPGSGFTGSHFPQTHTFHDFSPSHHQQLSSRPTRINLVCASQKESAAMARFIFCDHHAEHAKC